MNTRLKILFAQERGAYPYFTTAELAELFDISEAKIKAMAKKECWKAVTLHDVNAKGSVTKFKVWDVLSMDAERCMEIAFQHYLAEEQEYSLQMEVRSDLSKLASLFPETDIALHERALFHAKLFEMADDITRSLRISFPNALQVVCQIYKLKEADIYTIYNNLNGHKEFSFHSVSSEIRFAMFLQYFAKEQVHIKTLMAPHTNGVGKTVLLQ